VQDAAVPTATFTEAQRFRLEELYVAFFNRTPDADGLEYWIGRFKAGMTINEIAEAFYAAGVYFSDQTGYTPDMTDTQFVQKVYDYVLGRPNMPADDPGVAYWSNELALYAQTGGVQGKSRGVLVSTILDAAHNYKGGQIDPAYSWVADLLDNKIVVSESFAVDWGLNYNTLEESITQGKAIAAAITPTSIDAAIALIGIEPWQLDLT